MTAETLALLIAGVVAPIVINVIKRSFVGKVARLWVAYLVSAFIAFVANLITGAFTMEFIASDPIKFMGAMIEAATLVFGTATVVYKAKFLERLQSMLKLQ